MNQKLFFSFILLFVTIFCFSQSIEREVNAFTANAKVDENIDIELKQTLINNSQRVLNEFYSYSDFYNHIEGEFSNTKLTDIKDLFDNKNAVIFDYLLSREILTIEEFIQNIYNKQISKFIKSNISNVELQSIQLDNLDNVLLTYAVVVKSYSKLDKSGMMVYKKNPDEYQLEFILKSSAQNYERIKIKSISELGDFKPSGVGYTEFDYGVNLITGLFNNNLDNSTFGAGLNVNYLTSLGSSPKNSLIFGLDIDFFKITTNYSNTDNSMQSIDIPITYYENQNWQNSINSNGTVFLSGAEIVENLTLLSLSPSVGLNRKLFGNIDFEHSLKLFISGEFWLDSFLDNSIEYNGSSNIIPTSTNETPFPNTIDLIDVQEDHYALELTNVDISKTGLNAIPISFGLGYTYQRFTDYDNGIKFGLDFIFNPFIYTSSEQNNVLGLLDFEFVPASEGTTTSHDFVPIVGGNDRSAIEGTLLNLNGLNPNFFEIKLTVGFFNRANKEF